MTMERSIVESIMARLAPRIAAEKRRALYESNVFARAKREALRRHGIILRKTRPGSRREQELGRYYAVNAESTSSRPRTCASRMRPWSSK
jgi:hypothetical protein